MCGSELWTQLFDRSGSQDVQLDLGHGSQYQIWEERTVVPLHPGAKLQLDLICGVNVSKGFEHSFSGMNLMI